MSSDHLWANYAACKGLDTHQFFLTGVDATEVNRQVCEGCPARRGCGEAAMREEEPMGVVRFGFRAYMTPKQRETIARNGGLRGRDPMDVVKGIMRKDRKAQPAPVIPDDGGPEWKRTHTTLARRLRRWLPEHVAPDDWVPDIEVLAKELGCNSATPLDRLHVVLDALVQDGTLRLAAEGCYIRNPVDTGASS